MPNAKDAMTADAFIETGTHTGTHPIWDPDRLAELLADVGETGVRDLLRLLESDMAFLTRQLEGAIASGNAAASAKVLATIHDAAEGLGLSALATCARLLGPEPPGPALPDLLRRELARVRFVPSLKRAS
jgi:hypothetical protein